jgi:hypothetical protein
MRIALRTSGGRGEYELAGSHGSIGVSDVVDRELVVQLTPGAAPIATGNYVRRINGKTRIRLANQRLQEHVYLVLANALLLPKPKRELGNTSGGRLQLVENRYSIVSIQFDVIDLTQGRLHIAPTQLILSNADESLGRIDVVERTRILMDLWSGSDALPSPLRDYIQQHRSAFMRGLPVPLRDSVKKIHNALGRDDDYLSALIHESGASTEASYWMGLYQTDVESALADEDFRSLQEAAQNRIRAWRYQAQRGASGKRFSNEVRTAYNSTCFFTGYYLPPSDEIPTAGVDSAHILPWADYDLNRVSNGLCLSKLCHWAFDAGILKLIFDDALSKYVLQISEKAKAAERRGLITLAPFQGHLGVIPASRLPQNTNEWPSPQFLRRYNREAEL